MAFIDEERCIGCTKCLPPCPVDAIVGASRRMHTVLYEICTGCELCVAPCPVDCISMVPRSSLPEITPQLPPPDESRARYAARNERIARRAAEKSARLAAKKNAAYGRKSSERRAGSLMNAAKRREIFERFRAANPHPTTELEYQTPFELLVARDPLRAGHRQERECGNP